MVIRAIILVIFLAMTDGIGAINGGIGINGALGMTGMSGVDDDDTEASGLFRGSFGCFGMINFGNFFVQPAIILAWIGLKKEHTVQVPRASTSTVATEKISLSYLRVPVLVGYKFARLGKLTPRVLIGPSFNFNISGKDEATGFGSWDGEHDIGNLKTLDFGAIVGAGGSFPIGRLTLGADLFYNQSFSSAFKDVSEEELANDVNEELWTEIDPATSERTTKAVDYKNRGFSFQASILIPIGKN